MRGLLALACTLLLPLAAAGAQPATSGDRYTPRTGWHHRGDARFYERRFGRPLRAMDEPVLARAADLHGFRSRFRLLVLPVTEPPWAVRIDEPGRGEALLTIVELDRAGVDALGGVARRVRSQIAAEEVAELRAALDRARFERMAMQATTSEQLGGQCREDECGIVLCVRATHFVLERLDLSGRRFVERSACDVSEPFLELTGLLRTLRDRDR